MIIMIQIEIKSNKNFKGNKKFNNKIYKRDKINKMEGIKISKYKKNLLILKKKLKDDLKTLW